jgi:hypothetical protein
LDFPVNPVLPKDQPAYTFIKKCSIIEVLRLC